LLLKWLRVAFLAKARHALTDGLLLPGHSGAVFNGLDIAMIDSQLQAGKDDHASRLRHARESKTPDLTPQGWGAELLRFLKEDPTDERCLKLGSAAGAAYALDRELWRLARTSTYDFSQHDSDWIDRQQLMYLADPRIVMVTNEQSLLRRISGSGQEERVIRLPTLLTS
jgi:hypothetical protein